MTTAQYRLRSDDEPRDTSRNPPSNKSVEQIAKGGLSRWPGIRTLSSGRVPGATAHLSDGADAKAPPRCRGKEQIDELTNKV